MTSLHAFFTLRNQQAFQRLLESSRASISASLPSPSTSGGKSWNRLSALTSNAVPLDVNSRDWLGRTVLHLACSASDPAATEYVRSLLAHPAINVNIQDTESHWTPLHRALYHGNIASAILLLQRSDIDPSIKDHEGHIALDLYNSTVEHTAPSQHMEFNMTTGAEIFTWGDNKNGALGSGSEGDRNLPEHVILRSVNGEHDKISRFTPICARQLAMSKLHTAVVTMEDRNNVRLCGFASGGRLGPVQHLQYDLSPIQLHPRVIRVALGQDHTLALTESGAVYSWGLNRFSQLGYVIDQVTGGELLQATPKRIYGILRNKDVHGIAACKTASVCWTLDEVYTWGTNNGQLGYEKTAQPVQPLPRLVTKITNPVSCITITDSAMACLLESGKVVCLWNDRHFKINFQLPLFPPEIYVSSHRAALRTDIVKVTSCEETFGSLSRTGELFIFTLAGTDGVGGKDRMAIKPQRVWALRKQYSAVRDFALGSDGSIIICTESGHVFVRSRNVKGAQAATKAFKFQRTPSIQRVVGVCANSTGAFGALRVDFVPEPIKVVGNTISQDLAAIQPFMKYPSVPTVTSTTPYSPLCFEEESHDDDPAIQSDIMDIITLCNMLFADQQMRKDTNCGLFDGVCFPHGPDLMIQVENGLTVPIHSVVLYARCPVLYSVATHVVKDIQDTNIMIGSSPGKSSTAKCGLAPLTVNGCQPLSVLIFLVYLYSDHVLAVWDPRIYSAVENQVRLITRGGVGKIRLELQVLARILDMALLLQVLEGPTKKIPISSLVNSFRRVFDESQDIISKNLPFKPDVVLDLADRQVFCHSVLLRARSPLFAAFFDDDEWTVKRWSVDGTIVVNLKHLTWRVMEFVVQFMCCGADEEMFENITSVNSVDQLLDFMFDLMAAASELLIDRLVLICSAVILRHININNVCSVFAGASYYNATSLKEKVQVYMAVNMETLLESHMLDGLSPDLIRQLSSAVRKEQATKSPYIRGTKGIDELMKRHEHWLSLQDIPHTIVRSINHISSFKDSVRTSPKRKRHDNVDSSVGNLVVDPLSMKAGLSSGQDDIFVMDEEVTQTPSAQERQPSPKPSFGWKVLGSAHRTDMKTIMAEAENQKVVSRTPPSAGLGTSSSPRWSPGRTPQRTTSETLISRSISGSAWKTSGGHVSTSPLDLSTPDVSHPDTSSPSGLSQSRPGPSVAGGSDIRLPSSSVVTPSKQTPTSTTRPQTKPAKSPGLGPIFTPSRHQPHKSNSIAKSVSGGSNGNPWIAPVVKPATNPSPGAITSFAAIQLMQQEEYFTPTPSKQSLKEIQEEEQARRAEQEFLRWWNAEEERLKMENELVAAAVVESRKRGSKKPNKKKVSGENLQQQKDSGKKVKTKALKGNTS